MLYLRQLQSVSLTQYIRPPVPVSLIDVARRCQSSHDIARLDLTAQMGFWQNSTPFFGAAAFCMTKIGDSHTNEALGIVPLSLPLLVIIVFSYCLSIHMNTNHDVSYPFLCKICKKKVIQYCQNPTQTPTQCNSG